MLLLLSADFFKINFSKNSFRNTQSVIQFGSTSGPNLCRFAKAISRLTEVAASKERDKYSIFFLITLPLYHALYAIIKRFNPIYFSARVFALKSQVDNLSHLLRNFFLISYMNNFYQIAPKSNMAYAR